MKKILTIALSFLFILTATVLFSAAELPQEAKDLNVIYTNNSVGVTVPVIGGEASGELPNGTAFTAEDLPDGAVTLRIYPVQSNEKEVLDWIEDSLAKELDAAVTYYVICNDASGKEVSNNGVKITVSAPKTDEDITVCSLDSSGKVQSLTGTGKDGTVTFTATGAQLYPICVASENPGTSDGHTAVFAALFSVSVFAAVALLLAKRKRTV